VAGALYQVGQGLDAVVTLENKDITKLANIINERELPITSFDELLLILKENGMSDIAANDRLVNALWENLGSIENLAN
jgi:hypothetical protein